MKLALGTVQFGIEYGAFNTLGQVSMSDVAAILQRAKASNIDTLDTAQAYGASETVLGAQAALEHFRIVTKCPPIQDASDITARFEQSVRTLGGPVYGYLLHNAQNLLGQGADQVWAALEALRASGRVARIGVSAYSYEEAADVAKRFPITLVQLPANVLTPWFQTQRLPDTVEVHVRSAFLQGFLLSDPNALPDRFRPWRTTLHTFRDQATGAGLSQVQAALAPLLNSDAIDRVVVGVDGLAQLQDILTAIETIPTGVPDFGPFPEVTAALTDPRTWNEA